MGGYRTFGESEKEILRSIDKLNKDNVNIIARTILNNISSFKGEFATTTEDGTTNFSYSNDGTSVLLTKERIKHLCEFIWLIKYLIDEKYLFQITGSSKESIFFRETPRFINIDVIEELKTIWGSIYIVLPKFEEFIKNDFEELALYNEHKNNWWTRAIGIAAIVAPLITPVITSIVTSKCTNEPIQKISDSAVLSVKQAESENLSDEEPVLTVTNQPVSENSTEPVQTEAAEPVDKIETNTQTQGDSK